MTLRDQVQAEIDGAVREHERVRECLQRIDATWPRAAEWTLEIRHALIAETMRLNAIRVLLAKESMLGALEPRTAQEPVERLELFSAGAKAADDKAQRPYHDRMLAAAGDHSFDDDDGDKDVPAPCEREVAS